jgi:(1->4)-alpha-D-glucan 1-alpha-D-glucosylmutase
VDFQRRAQLLNHLKKQEKKRTKALIEELRAQWETGGIKLFVTYKALNFRRAHLDIFLHGDYLPLTAEGERQPHLVAFARRHESAWALVVAGRLFSKLAPSGELPLGEAIWGKTALVLPPEAPTQWRNIFTGDTVTTIAAAKNPTLPLKQVFSDLPVALLLGRSD